jgi:peptide/nickel transport system permease protein
MQRYIFFRLIQAIVALWLLSTAVFFILHVTGDPVSYLLPPDASAFQEQQLKESLGLDRPVYVRYAIFMQKAWTGDFGRSTTRGTEALDLLKERLPNTLQFAFASIFVCIFFGIPLGVMAAIKRDSIWDSIAKFLAVVGQSAPQFWLAILLILLLGQSRQNGGCPACPPLATAASSTWCCPALCWDGQSWLGWCA